MRRSTLSGNPLARISVYIKTCEDLLQKLHATFRRAPCVFCRFRKDQDLVGTQLNQLNALKHSHKSVIKKRSGLGAS